MDSFVIFWILIILLTIGLVTGLIYLGYWIPKRFGKKKLGKWIAGIMSLIVLTLILSIVFEDELFFKSDAKKMLAEHNIELKGNFKLNSNKFSGIGDFYHRFELTISANDKERLKNEITTAINFQQNVDEQFDLRLNKPRYADKEQGQEFTANYQTERKYIYEYYKPNEKGYKPTFNRISISKAENKLIYENISD
jgi:hypothetical protein